MLDINVASIKTTVSFVVDKQSLAEARKAGDDLKKYFEKIADPKIRFQAQKQRRQKARQQADDARFNDKPRDTKEMKAQRAAEKQKVRDEKANLKAKQQLQKRQEVAELRLRHAGLQISGIKGKYELDPKSQYEALRFIRQQTEEFAKGNLTSDRMNASIRGNAPIVGGGVLGSLALTAGSLGVGQRIVDKGNDNLELVRMSERVKTNPNAIKTMVAWGQQHGVDSANTSKAVDNMKDVWGWWHYVDNEQIWME
ncbi:hypothetical protein [Enterobacter sp.]|uniref:hypothetical protein n=1 Tax=Enterobacter sp. TaxID=42895 RepID=UPI002909DF2E|nr:hypothetical protein [Enterobacter sp.]MDU4186212.1 hypothetical protein [Enterobacter sp.]